MEEVEINWQFSWCLSPGWRSSSWSTSHYRLSQWFTCSRPSLAFPHGSPSGVCHLSCRFSRQQIWSAAHSNSRSDSIQSRELRSRLYPWPFQSIWLIHQLWSPWFLGKRWTPLLYRNHGRNSWNQDCLLLWPFRFREWSHRLFQHLQTL